MEQGDTLAAEPAVGEVLDDRYEIEEPLGRGGVGTVYRARRVKLGLSVGIKLLHPQSAVDGELRRRFEREARVMATLSHPNIVGITDFGVWSGRPYLVMELLEGETLRDRLRRGPMEVEEVVHVAGQFLQGLAYAHSQGLLHRDLKPENLFLQHLPDQRPHVKILDFGFAKFVDDEAPKKSDGPALTRQGIVFGTPTYMSPEQAMGDDMDARTDIYAAGVILFEMLTGKPPFSGDYVELRRIKVNQDPPSLATARPELNARAELEGLVARALDKERAGRFADGAALLEAWQSLPDPPIRGAVASLLPVAGRLLRSPKVALACAGAAALAAGLLWATGGGGEGAAATEAEAEAVAAAEAGSETAAEAETGSETAADTDTDADIETPTAAESAGKSVAESLANSTAGATDATEATAAAGADTKTGTAAEADLEPRAEAEAPPMVIELDEGTERPPPRERPRAGNPWRRSKLPAAVEVARARASKGRPVREASLKHVRKFARGNPEDPRPRLILAYVFMNRSWMSDAIARYETAYKVDPRSRGDARMRRDLLRLARSPKLARRAATAIALIYGGEAVPWVERTLAREPLTAAERTRLSALLERLRQG